MGSDDTRGKVAKDLADFWTGQATGVNTSRSTAGAMGAAKSSTSSTSKKVICTELHRQGGFTRADHQLGTRYVRDFLTPRHENGYHAWALFVVRRMRASRRWSAFFQKLAQARADHIAYIYGDASRKHKFGHLLCMLGEPTCYFIGGFVGERNWQALYSNDKPFKQG